MKKKKIILSFTVLIFATLSINSAAKSETVQKEEYNSNSYFYDISSSDISNNTFTDSKLPSYVDNSNDPAFPAIQNQIGGSCMLYSSDYVMTYLYNKYYGTSADDSSRIFSPKWSNNVGGCYNTLIELGVPTLKEVPIADEDYNLPDNYMKTWEARESVWKDANKHKVTNVYLGNLNELNNDYVKYFKSILASGKIFNIGTGSSQWQNFSKIKQNDNALENFQYSGEYYVPWQIEGNDHAMTVVGYDDNLWFDINNNGNVDEGEKGGFKIANSWGKNWGKNGYVWFPYDSLYKKSKVKNVDQPNRDFTIDDFRIVDIKPYEDQSKIYLELKMNTANIGSIRVNISAMDIDDSLEYTPVVMGGLNDGDQYSFSGGSEADDGTVVFDLSNCVKNLTTEQMKSTRWKVTVTDLEKDNKKLTVKDVKIIDDNDNKEYKSNMTSNIVLNGNSKDIIINPIDVEAPENLQVDNDKGNAVKISWDNVKQAKSYNIYRNGDFLANTSDNSYIDSETSNDKEYKYKVQSVSSDNGASLFSDEKSITINNNVVCIFYKNDSLGKSINIHYCIGNAGWTKAPGIPMADSTSMDGYKQITIDLDSANNMIACFNDGSTWDNNNGKNYTLNSGSYVINNGNLQKVNESNATINSFDIKSLDSTYKYRENTYGNSFELSLNVTDTSNNKYRFKVNDGENEKVIQDYSFTNTTVWKPEKSGHYTLIAEMKNDQGEVQRKTMNYYIATNPLKITNFVVDDGDGNNMFINKSIKLFAYAKSGDSNLKYEFYYKKDNQTVLLNNYSDNNVVNWQPKEAGNYTLVVKVKDEKGNIATEQKDVSIDAFQFSNVVFSEESPQQSNKKINVKADILGSGSLQYTFEEYGPYGYSLIYSGNSNNADWIPQTMGDYNIVVTVKDTVSGKSQIKKCKYKITESKTIIQEDNPNISYYGKWSSKTSLNNSEGKIKFTNQPGSMSFNFYGTGINVIAPKAKAYGKVNIIIDGESHVVDMYSSSTTYQNKIFSISNLSLSEHNITIEWLDSKNLKATGQYIVVDAFEIIDGNITDINSIKSIGDNEIDGYKGLWSYSKNPLYSNGEAIYTNSIGASVTAKFVGTSIKIISSKKSSFGIATITLDGTTYQVDLYSSTNKYSIPVFEKNDLNQGVHTLSISYSGNKNSKSSGKTILLDSLEIKGGDIIF